MYALLVCNEDGFIRDQDNPRYVIIQHTTEGQYGCSCETKNLYNYNTDKKCIHIQVAQQLKFDFQNEDTDKFKSSIKVCQIEQTSLFGIFSASQNSYGILKKTDKTIRCKVCSQKFNSCFHKMAFLKNASPIDQATNAANPQKFASVSKEKIPYPLTTIDKAKYIAYINGTPYPKHLVPVYNKLLKCQCGYLFSNDDPIASQWIKEKNAHLHLKDMSLKCMVNLNQKHLFSYAWMFEILQTGHEQTYIHT